MEFLRDASDPRSRPVLLTLAVGLATFATAAGRRSCCSRASAWTGRRGRRWSTSSRPSATSGASTCRASAARRRSRTGRAASTRSPTRSRAFLDGSRLERPHVAGNSLGGVVALELARRGHVASATALSPAGFGNLAEREFAWLSLRATYAIAARIHGRAPELLRRPRLRRLLYGQLYAHAERLTPGAAYSHMCVLLDGTGFHPVLEAMEGYRFRGPLRAPATIAWGTRDALLLPTRGAPRPPRAARGPAPVAARLRSRADERRPRADRAGAARGQQRRAAESARGGPARPRRSGSGGRGRGGRAHSGRRRTAGGSVCGRNAPQPPR